VGATVRVTRVLRIGAAEIATGQLVPRDTTGGDLYHVLLSGGQ
jgi:hypothetical protein